MCVISLEIVLDIDADFDTKLYQDFAYLFGCVGMDWGALAPGDVELSLEIFTLPPPSPKIKSQVKSVMEGWFPQTFWEKECGEISWGYQRIELKDLY